MKKVCLLILLTVVIQSFAFCQSISKQVLSSGGDAQRSSAANIQYSIGQSMTAGSTANSNNLTIGFHQFVLKNITSTEKPIEKSVHVYPNPVAKEVTIEFDRTLTLVSWHLSDLNGAIIRVDTNSTASGYQLDLSHIPAGTYFLHVNLKEGKTHPIKIVKE